jgi:hypothetical protein
MLRESTALLIAFGSPEHGGIYIFAGAKAIRGIAANGLTRKNSFGLQ